MAGDGLPSFADDRPAKTVAEVDQAVARLERRLAHAVPADATPALRDEIIQLYRAAEPLASASSGLSSRVKALASRWKALQPAATESTRPSSARIDHLGASTFLEKGWSRLSLGDAEGAEVVFRRALELAPGSAEGQVLLSWSLMEQLRFAEAERLLLPLLEREPEHALARSNLGFVRWRQQRYGEAIAELAQVIATSRDPKATLYAHLYLGQVYLEREMYDDARSFFTKAIALGPNLLHAHFELGRAHWFAGDRMGAVAAWQRGAQTNQFNPWGKRCAQMLAAVERGEAPSRGP